MNRCTHTTFVVERTLPGRPSHAFRFFAEPQLKRRWTACHPDWQELEAHMDFRIGGREVSRLQDPDGRMHAFCAHYLDIAAARRIIYAFTMRVDDALVSSSLATIELAASPAGTRMLYTEQAAFLRDQDVAPRRGGTGQGFDRLVAEIERAAATIQ